LSGASDDKADNSVENSKIATIQHDLKQQEMTKLIQKREKNKIAARKCRALKIELINSLSVQVAVLEVKNAELAEAIESLENEMKQLQQLLMDHMSSGCLIMNLGMRSMNFDHMQLSGFS
jgi:hypothetical protein